SRRALSPRRLHREEHERRCFLQQAQGVRVTNQGGQRRDQVDGNVVPNVRRQLGAAPASCNLSNFLRTLATPEPIKVWSLTNLKDKVIKIGAKVVSHGRYVVFQMAEVAITAANVPGDFVADRGTTAAAATSAGVRRSMVMHPRAIDRRGASQMPG